MRAAIIDLGTNTCNLLVADLAASQRGGGGFSRLHQRSLPVQLGRGGIGAGQLMPDAIERAAGVLSLFCEEAERFGVERTVAVATSAVRSANNQAQFLHVIAGHTGIQLEVLSGQQEAEMILRGVQALLPNDIGPYLMMDIGGGSIEFAVCQAANAAPAHLVSLEIGLARILEQHGHEDPLSPDTARAIAQAFNGYLGEVYAYAATVKDQRGMLTLVGSSGTFDTLARMAHLQFGTAAHVLDDVTPVSLAHAAALHQQMAPLNMEQRNQLVGMSPLRVEMIVIASLLIQTVIAGAGCTALLVSPYSLIEGVLLRLMDEVSGA